MAGTDCRASTRTRNAGTRKKEQTEARCGYVGDLVRPPSQIARPAIRTSCPTCRPRFRLDTKILFLGVSCGWHRKCQDALNSRGTATIKTCLDGWSSRSPQHPFPGSQSASEVTETPGTPLPAITARCRSYLL